MKKENIDYTPELLCRLRQRIETSGIMDGRRLSHTLGVSDECRRLARLFGFTPEDELRLAAAGLLHDITKQKSPEEQIGLCRRYGISYPEGAEHSPKVFHGWTAAALALDEYPEFCDRGMARAIYEHTTGGENMSVFSMLLYLADYIEPGRTYEDCVRLREYFYSGAEGKGGDDLHTHLLHTLLLSFDMTVRALLDEGEEIFPTTAVARNSVIRQLALP